MKPAAKAWKGEEAVAEVVMERTHNRNFPATICGVVYEGVEKGRRDCQFSFACDGAADRPKDRAAWRQVNMLAIRILSGAVKLSGLTDHAVAFHNADVTPAWAGTMEKTIQIGNHVFYRFAPHPLLDVAVTTVDTSAVDASADADCRWRRHRDLDRCRQPGVQRKSSPRSKQRALWVMAPEEM